MAFDPDAFLSSGTASGFDPDRFLQEDDYWGDVKKNAAEGLKQWPQAAETMVGQSVRIGKAMMPDQIVKSGIQAFQGTPSSETPVGQGTRALYDVGKGAASGIWQGIKDTGSVAKAPFEWLGGEDLAQTDIGKKFRERPLSVPTGVASTVLPAIKMLRGTGVAEEAAAGLPKTPPVVGKGTIPPIEPADIYYHGTNRADAIRKSGFSLKDPEGSSPYLGDNIVEGVYLSSSKEPYLEGGQLEGVKDVLPVKIEAQNILKTDIQGIENLYRKFGIDKFADDASTQLTEALKSQGYDGLQFMDETVIFDPSKIKLHEDIPSGQSAAGAVAPEQPIQLYHGTSAPEFSKFKTDVVYLAPDPIEAQVYADNQLLGGGGGGTPRVLPVNAKSGSIKDINAEIEKGLFEGNIESDVVDPAAQKARAEGYRYLSFNHPGVGDKDFKVIVSLYPEDLAIQKPGAKGAGTPPGPPPGPPPPGGPGMPPPEPPPPPGAGGPPPEPPPPGGFDPLAEMTDYMIKKYGKAQKTEGLTQNVGEALEQKGRGMRLKEIGASPGQVRHLRDRFGEDMVNNLSDLANEKGITKGFFNFQTGKAIKNLDTVSGQELGALRDLAVNRGATGHKAALIASIREQLDPVYMKGGTASVHKGAYLKALKDLENSGDDAASIANTITNTNKFIAGEKMLLPLSATRKVMGLASKLNNGFIEKYLNPEEVVHYNDNLTNVAAAKVFGKMYGFTYGRDMAGRTGPSGPINFIKDIGGRKIMEKVYSRIGRKLQKMTGGLPSPKALSADVLEAIDDALTEVIEQMGSGPESKAFGGIVGEMDNYLTPRYGETQ